MPQVRADPCIIVLRVVEAELLSDPQGRDPEEITHREQRIPGALAASIGIGLSQPLPQRRLEAALEVFAALPGFCENPSSHRCTRIASARAAPDDLLQHGFGVDDLLPPQSLRHVGGDPPELVAAVGVSFGGRRRGQIAALIRRCDRRDAPILIQEDNGQAILREVAELRERAEGQVDAVAVGELHEVAEGFVVARGRGAHLVGKLQDHPLAEAVDPGRVTPEGRHLRDTINDIIILEDVTAHGGWRASRQDHRPDSGILRARWPESGHNISRSLRMIKAVPLGGAGTSGIFTRYLRSFRL